MSRYLSWNYLGSGGVLNQIGLDMINTLPENALRILRHNCDSTSCCTISNVSMSQKYSFPPRVPSCCSVTASMCIAVDIIWDKLDFIRDILVSTAVMPWHRVNQSPWRFTRPSSRLHCGWLWRMAPPSWTRWSWRPCPAVVQDTPGHKWTRGDSNNHRVDQQVMHFD